MAASQRLGPSAVATRRIIRLVLSLLPLAMVAVLAGASRASSVVGALPVTSNTAAEATHPSPQVVSINLPWIGPVRGAAGTVNGVEPLLLSNGTYVTTSVDGRRECGSDCPTAGIEGFSQSGHQLWRFALNTYNLSQPIWLGSGLTFFHSTAPDVNSPGPDFLTTLTATGHVVSTQQTTLDAINDPQTYDTPWGMLVRFIPKLHASSEFGLMPEPNGHLTWQLTSSSAVNTNDLTYLGAAAGQLLFSTELTPYPTISQQLVAVSPSNGKVLWATPTLTLPASWSWFSRQQAVVGDYVVTEDVVISRQPPDKDHELAILVQSAQTGAILWRATPQEHMDYYHGYAGEPVANDTTLFVCNSLWAAGRLIGERPYCQGYSLATGQLQVSFSLPRVPVRTILDPLAASTRFLLVGVEEGPWRCPAGISGPRAEVCRPGQYALAIIPLANPGRARVLPAVIGQNQETFNLPTGSYTVISRHRMVRW